MTEPDATRAVIERLTYWWQRWLVWFRKRR
jgi:hypothetical protein